MEQNLNFEALKKNLMDVTKESQTKLGYEKNAISLYYPMESVNRLLDSAFDAEGLEEALGAFGTFARDTLGNVAVSHDGTRFCFLIPEDGVEYVHNNVHDNGFLEAFIAKVSRCGCTLEDILEVFSEYSDHVKCEKTDNGEFDYLVYFEDGVPDDFRYCIKLEEHGAIYHRFTPKDYDAFGF